MEIFPTLVGYSLWAIVPTSMELPVKLDQHKVSDGPNITLVSQGADLDRLRTNVFLQIFETIAQCARVGIPGYHYYS